MIRKHKSILVITSSILMLLAALPMLLWCLNLINNASLDYDYAGMGCFVAGITYVFSMLTGIAGLALASRPRRQRWCRILAYIQLATAVLLIFSLGPYAALTLPPLLVLTILYLFGVGWREEKHTVMKGERHGKKEQ